MGAFIGQLIDGRQRWLNWKSAVAGAVWCGLNLIALTVFGRWLAGALTGTPPTAEVCAAALLATVLGLAANSLFHQLDFRGEHWSWGALPAFLTLFPLMVLLVVIPDEAGAAWWFAATVACISIVAVFAMETTFRHRQYQAPEQSMPPEPAATDTTEISDNDIDAQLEARLAGTIAATEVEDSETVEMPWQSPSVTHWMTRSDADDGSISVEGVTAARFGAGENRTSVHITFTPPLPVSPQVECEPADDADVRIKVAAVFPHGVRIDLTRPAHDKREATVAIGYFAHTERKKTSEAAA